MENDETVKETLYQFLESRAQAKLAAQLQNNFHLGMDTSLELP